MFNSTRARWRIATAVGALALVASVSFAAANDEVSAGGENRSVAAVPAGFEQYLVYLSEPGEGAFEPTTYEEFLEVQADVYGRDADAVEAFRDEAIEFYADRFGLDFSSAPVGADGEQVIDGATMVPSFVRLERNYHVHTIGGDWVPPTGWDVRDASFNVMFTDDIVLHGTYGGAAGKEGPAGALLAFGDNDVVAEGGPVRLRLRSPYPLDVHDATVSCVFDIAEGERAVFAVAHASGHDDADFAEIDADGAIDNARMAWASWVEAHPGYEGARAELARHSALILQGLTYKPTGAVLAAATTSLPAAFGESSNWDYRYAWLRDLSLTGQALWIAACPDEASRYLDFLTSAAGTPTPGSRVQIVYGVDGRRDLSEHELDHLDGFRNSRPVRTGNAAWDQSQLDVMGEVLDMAHRFADQLEPLDEPVQRLLVWLADQAADTWTSPDAGMWEAHDEERHYLTSKVMCWVALDRAVDLAALLGDRAEPDRWAEVRDEIRDTVLREGWNDELKAFTGAFGSDRLDASVLLLPLVGFLPADDERMRSTIEAVERELTREGLVYRWDGDTNGFVLCSYWLVECLALAGETERAPALFDRLTARSNDLGLFSEQVDPTTGEMTGNFPQAFSHVGLINAAWRLDTLDDDRNSHQNDT